jgi:glycosyltransferase involved in cell wall biosynthesis
LKIYRVAIFRSNPIAPDPRVEKIAYALSKSYEVHVVGWDRTGENPAQKTYPHFTLELFSKVSKYGSGIKNLLDLLGWQFYLLRWVLRHGRSYQLVHACDFDTVLPALLGKLFFRYKVIYDIFDFYADHIRNTPTWLKQLIRWLDHKAVRLADAVILVTEAQLSQLGHVKPRRLVIIYNTPIDTEISSISPDDPVIQLRIAYIGILQVERGLLEMLEVVQKHSNWHFDLAGFGGDESIIIRRALEVPNVSWFGRVSYSKALEITQAADVLFSTCDPDVSNYRHASANKLFEAMMLAKPIIVARGTNMDLMVEEFHCGLIVPYGDTNALQESLERLAHDIEFRSTLGQNGRKIYEESYSWVKMENRLLDLYSELEDISTADGL